MEIMIEKFINDLLAQLGAGSKEVVYLSVTPGVGLELIQVDPVIKSVKTYGHKPLEYSDSMREISNYDDFKTTLEELFSELNISPKCNIVLNLPMVHFGKVDLPLLLNDEGVTEAVISEVEQAYIFKRCEPVVSWFDGSSSSASDTRTIFYSAVQKPAVDKIKEILTELGATLSGVEISLVSALRALSFAGLTEAQMQEGTPWNLMIVNATGYNLVAMSGKNIVDYYEEPLALKTYELDEIYEAISASVQIAMMNFPTNYLYIVSETDLVSAEHLTSKLQFEGKIDFLENNSFRKREILPVSLNILPDQVMKISLESVGIAVSKSYNYPIKLDFSENKVSEFSSGSEETLSFHFNDKEIVLTETVLKKMSFVVAGLLIIPALVAMLTLPVVEKKNQAKLDEINSKIKNIDAEIKKLTEQASASGSFVVKTEIENVIKYNRNKLISYSALGESVPADLWITYFMVKETGKIDIKGVSENVEDIYIFFKNMKDYLVDSQLRLHKLEMTSSSIDDAVVSNGPTTYEFEITNMTEGEINPSAAKSSTAKTEDESAASGEKASGGKKSTKTKKVNDLEPVDINGG